MKIVAQMDDIFSINIKTDTTFLMLLEAQNRGHDIYFYTPETLSYNVHQQNIFATISKIKLNNSSSFCEILEKKNEKLTNFDVILIRQNPPFDMNYITSTYFLEKIMDLVLIINNPQNIRNCPEKIFVTNFPKLTPPTIITSDFEAIKEFHKKYKKIILKPLYSYGADGVFLIDEFGLNLNSTLEIMQKTYLSPIIAQKFIDEISFGDKRIFLLDGEPIGAISRNPQSGEIRSNLHIGGNASIAHLNARDLEICNTIKSELKKLDLLLVGIDVIGDYLTEINVTSPTCIPEINHFHNLKLERKIIDIIEEKFKNFQINKSKSLL
jgi:glutathione synthase